MPKTKLLNCLLIVVFVMSLVAQPSAALAMPGPAAAVDALAPGLADAGFTLIADFEEVDLPTGFVKYTDALDGTGSSTTVTLALEASALPLLPAAASNQAVKISYDITATGGWGGNPGYAGVTQDFSATQDWSDYTYFSMLVSGSNSGKTAQIELKSEGDSAGLSNRFVYPFTDNFSGWKLIVVPFSAFVNRTDYTPGPDDLAPINKMKMWGYSLMLPGPGAGIMYLDRVAVAGQMAIHNFDADTLPVGFVPFWDAKDGTGSTSTLSAVIEASDIPLIPTGSPNRGVKVTYDIAASGGWGGGPGYGGVSYDTPAAQDWSDYQSFSLWFNGTNTGNELRIELKSEGMTSGASNRFVYPFTDDFTGWKLINVPFSAFVNRTDYAPGPNPAAPINLLKMWGYALLIPGGAAGSFIIDEVNLFGKPASTVSKLEFANAAFSANEGDLATVTVKLSMAAAADVTVHYATSNGTAQAGTDYTAASGTLTFLAGETSATFTVQTTQDTTSEINETVNLTLSAPTGTAVLGALDAAVLSIVDDDAAKVISGDPFVKIVDDYEYTAGLPNPTDSFGNQIGFVAWGGPSGASYPTLANPQISDSADPLAVPGVDVPNRLLQIDFNIPAGGWGGFTHVFEVGNDWVSQDWHAYTGVSFWIYGTNSGGVVNLDIFDNKTTTGDSAERWEYDFTDNFTGWKYVQIPWEYFFRKTSFQPSGAPNDGLTLTETWGYAFGFPTNTGAKTMYIDNFGLMVRHTMVENYSAPLTTIDDPTAGIQIGYVTWGGPSGASYPTLSAKVVTETTDPLFVPYIGVPNTLLAVDYNIPAGGWGGFNQLFAPAGVWTSQDWSTYDGISFWMNGTGTGGTVNIDIFDNKTTAGDSAERWEYDFTDNFTGWKFISVPFTSFFRKTTFQPGGAPNDGLTLTEMWGYAFGLPNNTGAKTLHFDNIEVYGNNQAPVVDLALTFAKLSYTVDEGETATVDIKLSTVSDQIVTVNYDVSGGSARPNRDYTPTSGTLTFQPGETLKSFDVVSLPDSVYEGNVTVKMTLSGAVNAPLGATAQMELTIVDNDIFDGLMIDNFELLNAPYRYSPALDVTRELADVAVGDALAVLGQDPLNSVLLVDVAGTTPPAQTVVPSTLTRTFGQSVDWSTHSGLEFWYNGTGSGQEVTVTLQDNRATDVTGPAGWNVVWNDEFDSAAGTQPDQNKWGYDLGGGGFGNSEHEYYTTNAENASTDGAGNLAIVAKKIADPAASGLTCWYGPCKYTSARILSKGKFDFAYGRAEARLKIPYGQGIWPAFWMLGSDIDQVNWPTSGELDIMENIGKEPDTVHGTIHGPGYSGGNGIGAAYTLPNGEAFSDQFHTFAVEWEPNVIRWYVDGNLYNTIVSTDIPAGTEWVFDHPFFLILNLAVGGGWPGYPDDTTTFPQTLLVDYVRVYQADDTAERFSTTFTDDTDGWKKVKVPFASFTRDANQPVGAPADGLTLTNVWGYGFEFPVSETAQTYYLDNIALSANYSFWLTMIQR